MKTSGRTLRTQRLVPIATTAAMAQMVMVSPPVPPISARSVRVCVRWSASHSDEVSVGGVDAALEPLRDEPAQAEHHDEDRGPDDDDFSGHDGVLPPTRPTYPPLASARHSADRCPACALDSLSVSWATTRTRCPKTAKQTRMRRRPVAPEARSRMLRRR